MAPGALAVAPWAAARPCTGAQSAHCVYREGLAVAWRGLHADGAPVGFAFGHGLSYTNFSYAWVDPPAAAPDGGVALTVRVTNVGGVPGAEVAQLYVRYPPHAHEPPLVLRGFEKTAVLAPGGAQDLRFTLAPRALSVWAASGADGDAAGADAAGSAAGRWARIAGTFTMVVGGGSRDPRLEGTVEVRA